MGEGKPVADAHTLQVLEFDRILGQLAEHACWQGGRELALSLSPSADAGEVADRLQETAEAVLLEEEGFSLGGVQDVRRQVARAQVGATLEPGELLNVAATLAASRRVRRLLEEERDRVPRLSRWAAVLVSLPELEERITTCITPQGEVADEASPRLYRIRRSMRLLQSRLRDQMESYIRSPQFLRHLQEPIITVRDGRYVLPVKVEARAQVPGIIHDQSASGATLFIEPMATVELNNELRRLSVEEREEVARILAEISGRVGAHGRDLLAALDALAELDLALAKARYALALSASRPSLNQDGRLDLRGARHPLLGRAAVPIDVRLGRDFDTLVISGPNTGGKTVALKTVGLLTLMAQAGMYIPCQPGSEVAVFRRVHADIGDEQSIEQSLSTFSSHMRNIVATIRDAGPGTLVLLDELGAGTDPAQGAALGMAILEYLQQAGCRTVVTTHSGELKAFAYSHPRVESAAVEFDPVTLEPTYRLQIGTPGFSNAFAIAARLGLPSEVVARAHSLLSPDQQRQEGLLAALAEDRMRAAEELEAARCARREAELARREAERLLAVLREGQEAALARARARAQELVEGLRREIEAVSATLRQAAREEDRRRRQAALEEARRTLRMLRERADAIPASALPPTEPGQVLSPAPGREQERPPAPRLTEREQGGMPTAGDLAARPERLLVGSKVRILGAGREGYLISPPDAEGRVEVQVGILRTRVLASDVVLLAEPAGRPAGDLPIRKAREVSPEIHLRGMTVEEALEVLGKYLDDVVLAGQKTVRIVHGKGTGALRRAVAEFLSRHPQVESFRLADASEGGEGATVVQMR
ncbi:MAG: endonuclease MutS2 [Bacillota bacterium]